MSPRPRPARTPRTGRLRAAAVALTGGLVLAATAPVAAFQSPATSATSANAASVAAQPYLVGRGIADVTGEPAEAGMMGYADLGQTSNGLHMRQRARAFVIVDRATDRRVLHVNADVGMIFQSVRDAVLARLTARFGDRYREANVMLTATHTHAGPGGFSHHNLYNITTLGYHDKTFRATVDGIVAAAERAEADLAPADLRVATTQLGNASANRSKRAYDRNPAADRAQFSAGGTDTASTTLQVLRDGRLDGVLNWFAVHATSMSTDNQLVSPDNKGYAGYLWEHEHEGVDYLDDSADPDFVASFAQTNSGDMSPNLDLRPGTGPTSDQFENTRIIGTRMVGAAQRSLTSPTRRLVGGVDSRLVHVDLADTLVDGQFTPDGQDHRTCPAAFGAAFAAGSTEDGGGGLPIFKEGKDGGNPLVKVVADALYTASPSLKACQAPKEVLLPVGALDLVQQKLPVQLVRIGDLYVVGMPAEVTIVSGLRLRRAVAEVMGVGIDKVLVQGYTNAYAHYVTTPEEYDAGEYEGASTLFGRYELPAFVQTVHGLAAHMKAGTTPPLGAKERDRSAGQVPSLQGKVVVDDPHLFKKFGDVLTAPSAAYDVGQRVQVEFSGAHPNNHLRHGSTYLTVERKVGASWQRVADDGDWETRFRWRRDGISASRITITWDVPRGTPAGSYRIRYFGDARSLLGTVRPVSGTSPTFAVR
ncbi:neutral/alkaline ceramidase [Nocardioides daphniae]|uniref:neutral/alkaline ceramidase n=1 Tax=Nocardioides daphniae TaxID=402297 RepID=UPI001E2F20CF|nr:neutral/alkaline ceramidase [Nocardioides daphniae]